MKSIKRYLNEDYGSLIHGNIGNDGARVVSVKMERLFQAIYRNNKKPFVNEVHSLYLEFVSGTKELIDKETGEVYNPEEFRHKGRALEVSESTIREYLKDPVNYTSTYSQ